MWLERHIFVNAVPPIVTFDDGYTSHFVPNCIQFARGNLVIIISVFILIPRLSIASWYYLF